jgi:ABC-type antimicrobial peptide transport system permease subunit
VYGDGLAVAAVGLALGAGGAWALSRGLTALTYEVEPSSPTLWLTVLATIAVATLAAMWNPARDAARSDPAMLMQEE